MHDGTIAVLMSDPDPLHPRFGEVWEHQGDGRVMVVGPSQEGYGRYLAILLDLETSQGFISEWSFDRQCEIDRHWHRIEERETWD